MQPVVGDGVRGAQRRATTLAIRASLVQNCPSGWRKLCSTISAGGCIPRPCELQTRVQYDQLIKDNIGAVLNILAEYAVERPDCQNVAVGKSLSSWSISVKGI